MAEQSLAEGYASAALDYPWPAGRPASVVGRNLILRLNAKRGWYTAPPLLWEDEIPEAPDILVANSVREWRRLPSEYEQTFLSYVHVYDRAGDYLSIAEGAMLPTGRPEWIEGAVYSKQPGQSAPAGLWHVEVDYDGSHWNGRVLPAVCQEGTAWLWTAALRAAIDCGYRVAPAGGAILWPEQHHILGTWAKRVWQARMALENGTQEQFPDRFAVHEAVALVKLLYTSTIGMFAYKSYEPRELSADEREAGCEEYDIDRWYRPEWHRTILAEALARTFYAMRKAVAEELWPLWARVDTLAFCSDELPEHTAHLAGLYTKPGACGAWRHEYTLPMVAGSPLLELRPAKIEVAGERHKLPGVRQ